jgi:hypothetical protein
VPAHDFLSTAHDPVGGIHGALAEEDGLHPFVR